MRKFMALGLSAISAATFAFAVVAPAAHADIIDDVCGLLPGINVDNGSAVSHAAGVAALSDSTLATKAAALTTAATAFGTAVADQLNAVAGGGDTSVTTAALNLATTNVGNAFVGWSNANAGSYTAHQTLSVAQMQQNILSSLSGGIVC